MGSTSQQRQRAPGREAQLAARAIRERPQRVDRVGIESRERGQCRDRDAPVVLDDQPRAQGRRRDGAGVGRRRSGLRAAPRSRTARRRARRSATGAQRPPRRARGRRAPRSSAAAAASLGGRRMLVGHAGKGEPEHVRALGDQRDVGVRAERQPAAVVDGEQEAAGQSGEDRVASRARGRARPRSRRSSASAAGCRPASGLASTLRTSSCSDDGSSPASASRSATGSAASSGSPRICRFAREVSSAIPFPSRAAAAIAAELTRLDAPARQAHASQPAVLGGVQRQARRGNDLPRCASRGVLWSSCRHAARPGPSAYSVGRGHGRAARAPPRDDRLPGHDALRRACEDEADRRPEHRLHARPTPRGSGTA